MSRHYIIPIFVPHYGCPHDCVFCNQKRITGLSTDITSVDVEKIIEEYLETFQMNSTIEVAFYGGSFTAIDLKIQKQLLAVPYKYKKEGKIDGIRLSTRPDAINDEILRVLKEYLVDTIELGVQSLDDEVLRQSGRGHSSEDVYLAANSIKKHEINLGLQMMIGLPSDSLEKSIHTCLEFIKLDPYCVRIYPTLVIKDTYLEKQYIKGNYNPIGLEEGVYRSAILLILFDINKINVIRVGLQPTKNIQLGKDVVAGPFHPSFRQLVETYIYKILLDYYFKSRNIDTQDETFIIESNKKMISSISGQKSSNIKYFKEKYKFKNIKIYEGVLDKDHIAITVGEFYDKIDMNSLKKSYLKEYFAFKGIKGH